MTEVLTPLPAPVAVDVNYIAQRNEKLKLERGLVSSTWTVTLEDGTVLMSIDGQFMSASQRKTVKDNKGEKMYQIRRESLREGTKYYAETTEGGSRVWEMEMEYHFDGTESIIKFSNAANSGNPDHLEFKNNPVGSTGYVSYKGQPVAMIKKKKWHMGNLFELTIVEGLDMTLVVGIILSMDSKVKTSNSRAAAGGGGAATAA